MPSLSLTRTWLPTSGEVSLICVCPRIHWQQDILAPKCAGGGRINCASVYQPIPPGNPQGRSSGRVTITFRRWIPSSILAGCYPLTEVTGLPWLITYRERGGNGAGSPACWVVSVLTPGPLGGSTLRWIIW